MKKYFSLIFILSVAFCLCGCKNNPAPANNDVSDVESVGESVIPAGEVSKIVVYQEDDPDQKHFYEFAYDKSGRIVKMTESYSNNDEKYVTAVIYDDSNLTTTVKTYDGAEIVYTDKGDGVIAAVVTGMEENPYEEEYKFDDRHLQSYTSTGQYSPKSVSYSWDSDDRITKKVTEYPDGVIGIDTFSQYSNLLFSTKVNIVDLVTNSRLGISSLYPGVASIFYPTLINGIGQEEGETVSADWTEYAYEAAEENEDGDLLVTRIRYSYGEDWRVYMIVEVSYENF